MRRFPTLFALVVAAVGCATVPTSIAPVAVTSAPPPTEASPVPSPRMAATVAESAPPPAVAARGTDMRVSYGIPRVEEWDDLGPSAMARMKRWTPDAVIGNRVTNAKIAFASVPAVGTVTEVAEGLRDQMNAVSVRTDVVMADVAGRRAGFTFETTKDGRRGKVIVTRVPGLDAQYVLLVGEWPADADGTSVADIDAVAKSISATPAP